MNQITTFPVLQPTFQQGSFTFGPSGTGGGVGNGGANLNQQGFSKEFRGDIYSSRGRFGNGTNFFIIEATEMRTANFVSGSSGCRIGYDANVEFNDGVFRGQIVASSGVIGGFTITATEMYGGIIKTAATVGVGSTGVIMDTSGLRGYDSVLGLVFNLPTNGSAPTFSSGIINNTIFNINTNSVIRTSATVGDGTVNSAGVLVNSTGIYACEASQLLANANVRILADGSITALVGTFGPWTISGNTFSTTANNISIGTGAGASITTGVNNIFFGLNAGNANTDGHENFFAGVSAGFHCIGGYNNVAIGNGSGQEMTSAHDNFFAGFCAGWTVTIGHNNLAIGGSSLGGNLDPGIDFTTGNYNLCLGNFSGANITSGSSNVFVAYGAGQNTTIGNANVFIGESSGYTNVDGENNCFFGYYSGFSNLSGDSNLCLGIRSGYTNSTGSNSIYIGVNAGYYETASDKLFIDNAKRLSEADGRAKALIYGIFAAATADQYLYFNGNVTISNTLTVGSLAGFVRATAGVISASALVSGDIPDISATYSVVGHDHSGVYQPLDADLTAIAGLSSADSNIIVGSAGGWVAESGATARTSLGLGTGDSPTFAGEAIQKATGTGIYDYIGLSLATTGTATSNITHQSSPDFILQSKIWTGAAQAAKNFHFQIQGISGSDSQYKLGIASSEVIIAEFRGDTGTVTMPYVYSTTVGVTNRDVYIDNTGLVGYVSSSIRYKENVKDLDSSWIYNLNPVSYTYKSDKTYAEQYGLIAEEVNRIKPELVSYDKEGKPETVSYSKLIAPLLKEIQKLNERIKILESN